MFVSLHRIMKEKLVLNIFKNQHRMANWDTEDESDDQQCAVEMDNLSASLGTLTMASSSISSRGGKANHLLIIKRTKESPKARKKNTLDDAKGDDKDDCEHKSETEQKKEQRMVKCEQRMTKKRKGHVRQQTSVRASSSQTRKHYPTAQTSKSKELKAQNQGQWSGEDVSAKDWFFKECDERHLLPWDSEALDLWYQVDSEYERNVTSDDSDPTGRYCDM